jgi:hypothetical protein
VSGGGFVVRTRQEAEADLAKSNEHALKRARRGSVHLDWHLAASEHCSRCVSDGEPMGYKAVTTLAALPGIKLACLLQNLHCDHNLKFATRDHDLKFATCDHDLKFATCDHDLKFATCDDDLKFATCDHDLKFATCEL